MEHCSEHRHIELTINLKKYKTFAICVVIFIINDIYLF